MNVCRISLREMALRASLLVCAAMLLPSSMARADVGAVVFAWGDNSALQLDFPPGLTNVTAVAAGGSHSLALNKEGFVTGWGFDLFGQAFPPSTLKNVTAIAAGEAHSIALR